MSHPSQARPRELQDLDERWQAELARQRAICQQARAAYVEAQAAWEQAQSTFERARQDYLRRRLTRPARKELLRRSAYARLVARLETMPTIEQAKGIIMAQSGCPDGQAFDTLRRASQRLNIPVRDLAAKIVASTTQRGQSQRLARAEHKAPDRRGADLMLAGQH